MGIPYLFTCRPVNPRRQVDRSTGGQERLTHNALYSYIYLSTCQPCRQVDMLTGRQVNKYGIPIMPCTPIFTPGPVNPGRQVDRSTG